MSDLFKGTAEYYAEFRPQIPQEVVDYLKERFKLDGEGTLLDLGCGTGQSTFALVSLLTKAVAIDPDADMLKQAARRTPKGLDIDWQERSDKDITEAEGPYRLVIASRAFHWMDQYPLLEKLSKISEPQGGIALIGDGSFWTGQEPWQKKIKEVIQEFLGEERRAGKSTFSASKEPYVDMLTKTGYQDVEAKVVNVKRDWTIEQIIGCLYSTSFAAPHLFGDRKMNLKKGLEKSC